MLAEAARRLAAFGDRVQYVRADLGQPLPLDQQVDAVFSTAAFHWVPDHDALFANLAAVLRPGGALVAQCGGTGNVASVMAAAAALGRPLPSDTINFPTAEATARRLGASGFRDAWVWLQDEPTPFESAEQIETYLAAV